MDLAKNLKVESVSRLLPPAPLTVAPQTTIRQAVGLMQERGLGCALVCEGERVLGIFTERDLLKRVLAPGKSMNAAIKDYMTPNPVTVRLKDSVAAALRRMQEGQYRHLPVVDEGDRAVAMLSVKLIVRFMVDHYASTVYNQPPDPNAVQNKPEGA